MPEETKMQRAPRYELSSISATVDGKPLEIIDVSPTGMLVKKLDPGFERGDVVTVNLSVPLMKKIVPVNVDGFVIRTDDRGTALDYVRPATTWPHVLKVLDYREHKSAG